MALIDCPQCGHKVDETSAQCIYCGWGSVERPAKYCPECGHQTLGEAKICPYCGSGVAELPPNGDRGSQAGQRQRQLELQLELADIDLEWERERQKYLVDRGPLGGGRQVPTQGMASCGVVLVPIIGIAIGICCLVFDPDPIRGLVRGVFYAALLLVLGLVGGRWVNRKAVVYEQAVAAYQRKREAARARHETEARP